MKNTTIYNKRLSSTRRYIHNILQVYSKINIARIDLAYKKPYSDNITLEEAYGNLKHMLNRTRSNKTVFGHMVGYIVKREYTIDRGVHFHAVFVFDGQKMQKDVYKAEQIGEYWMKVTNNKGSYHNCNRNEYKDTAIGMINYYDEEKIELLVNKAVGYFCKDTQSISDLTEGNRYKAFTRGVAPRVNRGVGRPRTKAMGMLWEKD